MDSTFNDILQKYSHTGWRCPICGRVYSPWTNACYNCGQSSGLTANEFRIIYGLKPVVNCEELVRCKDCEYCQAGWIYAQNANGTQTIVNECHYFKPPMAVELNHYCSHGKRSEEKGVDSNA